MSVLQDDTRTQRSPRVAAPAIRGARGDPATWCSCNAMSLPSPAGAFIVLRIAGEVDLSTVDGMQAALAEALQQRPNYLLVDLAELVFCSARGLALLVAAGNTAAGQGTVYAVSTASDLINRVWTTGWPDGELPTGYPTTAAGILAMTYQPGRQDRNQDHPARQQTAGSRCCTARSVPSQPAAPRLAVG
jgi:anti-anti-sigma factor